MYQIDVSTAAPALPAPSAAGEPGYFTDGDLTGGVAPTIVPAEFLNMLMMELLNLIVGAGVMPAKGKNNQVLAATTTLAFQAGVPRYINAALPQGQVLAVGSYAVDTSAGSIALPLPAAPPAGTILEFSDFAGTWDAYPLTLSRNGATILGVADDFVANVRGEDFRIAYNGSDWRINYAT